MDTVAPDLKADAVATHTGPAIARKEGEEYQKPDETAEDLERGHVGRQLARGDGHAGERRQRPAHPQRRGYYGLAT